MNILIIGSGAREHALAKVLKLSKHNPKIFCYAATKNPGIFSLTTEYQLGNICETRAIIKKAQQWKIDLAIIGPEAPLAEGLADLFWLEGIPTIGPKKILAQIETSKAFTRDLLKKYNIPGSLNYQIFNDLSSVNEFLYTLGEDNFVIKANGLMGGKGVKVAGDHLHTFSDAYQFCAEICKAGQSFVIEEKLVGQEFSLLAFSDGINLINMPPVQDNKRAFLNDEGPNTGGMGSFSDANHSLPFLTEGDLEKAQEINKLVLNALTKECGEKYIGILYGSFIATKNGVQVIEYNARFGDPESLNLLKILETDFVDICQAMVEGTLTQIPVKFGNYATVCKYAVPKGYPEQPLTNFEIDISKIANSENLFLGAIHESAGKLYATGSRTAAVVGVAKTIHDAEAIAEAEINRIIGPLFHRKDIGTSALIKRRVLHMQELRQCNV